MGDGLKTVYAGRAMTMWDTREEAEASWRAPSVIDLVPRERVIFWRETRLETVDCPDDVDLQAVLKRDL